MLQLHRLSEVDSEVNDIIFIFCSVTVVLSKTSSRRHAERDKDTYMES